MKQRLITIGLFFIISGLCILGAELTAPVKPVELGSKWEVTCTDTETGKVTYHAVGVEYPVSNFLPRNSRTVCVGRRLPK